MTSVALDMDFVVRQAFLDLISHGEPIGQACKRMGISRRAVNALVERDPEFAEDYHEATSTAVERVEDVAYKKAIDGEYKFVELFFRRHHPEMFNSKAIGSNGRGAAPQVNVAHITVKIGQALMMGDHSDEWMAALHASPAIEVTASEPDDEPGP